MASCRVDPSPRFRNVKTSGLPSHRGARKKALQTMKPEVPESVQSQRGKIMDGSRVKGPETRSNLPTLWIHGWI